MTENVPIKIHAIQYKCSCGYEKANKHNQLILPIGLKGMKCPECNKWGSFVATVRDGDSIRRFAVLETKGIDDVKILGEEEVDEHLNPILDAEEALQE